jgi:hypothetical protein
MKKLDSKKLIKVDELEAEVSLSPELTMWDKVISAREHTIKSLEESLIIEKAILEMAKEKLEDAKAE